MFFSFNASPEVVEVSWLEPNKYGGSHQKRKQEELKNISLFF